MASSVGIRRPNFSQPPPESTNDVTLPTVASISESSAKSESPVKRAPAKKSGGTSTTSDDSRKRKREDEATKESQEDMAPPPAKRSKALKPAPVTEDDMEVEEEEMDVKPAPKSVPKKSSVAKASGAKKASAASVENDAEEVDVSPPVKKTSSKKQKKEDAITEDSEETPPAKKAGSKSSATSKSGEEVKKAADDETEEDDVNPPVKKTSSKKQKKEDAITEDSEEKPPAKKARAKSSGSAKKVGSKSSATSKSGEEVKKAVDDETEEDEETRGVVAEIDNYHWRTKRTEPKPTTYATAKALRNGDITDFAIAAAVSWAKATLSGKDIDASQLLQSTLDSKYGESPAGIKIWETLTQKYACFSRHAHASKTASHAKQAIHRMAVELTETPGIRGRVEIHDQITDVTSVLLYEPHLSPEAVAKMKKTSLRDVENFIKSSTDPITSHCRFLHPDPMDAPVDDVLLAMKYAKSADAEIKTMYANGLIREDPKPETPKARASSLNSHLADELTEDDLRRVVKNGIKEQATWDILEKILSGVKFTGRQPGQRKTELA